MPLYEYECRKCGKTVEKIQKFSDKPLTKCPACGGRLERLLSAPAIQFKGTGWYVTDYARKSSGDNGGSGRKSKQSESKKPEPAASTKPAGTSPASKS